MQRDTGADAGQRHGGGQRGAVDRDARRSDKRNAHGAQPRRAAAMGLILSRHVTHVNEALARHQRLTEMARCLLRAALVCMWSRVPRRLNSGTSCGSAAAGNARAAKSRFLWPLPAVSRAADRSRRGSRTRCARPLGEPSDAGGLGLLRPQPRSARERYRGAPAGRRASCRRQLRARGWP